MLQFVTMLVLQIYLFWNIRNFVFPKCKVPEIKWIFGKVSISWKTRKAFSWENMAKDFFWENISNFLGFPFPEILKQECSISQNRIFWGSWIFLFFKLGPKDGPGSCIIYYLSIVSYLYIFIYIRIYLAFVQNPFILKIFQKSWCFLTSWYAHICVHIRDKQDEQTNKTIIMLLGDNMMKDLNGWNLSQKANSYKLWFQIFIWCKSRSYE